MAPLLVLSDIAVRNNGNALIENLALDISPGQAWAVIGPNGAGKTSLLKTLAGLRPASNGHIHFQQRPLHEYSRRQIANQLGYLSENDAESFPLSVYDCVLSGSYSQHGRFTGPARQHHAACEHAIAQTHLNNFRQRPITHLSAGERRRVAIARLLVQQPRLALVDEPVNHLDIKQQLDMMDLLVENFLTRERALVVILHDIRIARKYCSHALILYGNGAWQAADISLLDDKKLLGRLYRLSDKQLSML